MDIFYGPARVIDERNRESEKKQEGAQERHVVLLVARSFRAARAGARGRDYNSYNKPINTPASAAARPNT